MRKFSFYEAFLSCAESEAESVSEIDDSNEHERRAQTSFSRTCVRSKDDKTFSDFLNARKSLEGLYIEGFENFP